MGATLNKHPTRLTMHYEVEVHGLLRRVELPFVTAVLADLTGMPTEPLPPVAQRAFTTIDAGNFDACLAAAQPRAVFQVHNLLTGEGHLSVDLRFTCLDDFRPERVLQQIEPLRRLVQARSAGPAPPPPSPPLATGPEPTMAELMQLALQGALPPAPSSTAPAAPPPGVPEVLDRKVDDQLNLVMHHAQLQRLEATWRGLHHLVRHSETGDDLQIRVLNLPKADLARILKRYKGASWDQSPLYQRLVGDGWGSAGGDPIGCVVLDAAFDQSPADVEALRDLSRIGAAMHAPIVAAAAPALLQMDSWLELPNPRDLSKIFQNVEYAAWRSLRDDDDARYLVLTMPNFLARAPYRRPAGHAADYCFNESLDAGTHRDGVWASGAYLLALNLHRAFKVYGQCTRIRGLQGGGAVEDLPGAAAPASAGSPSTWCPTEVAIQDRRASELARNGLAALVWRSNAGMAVFMHTPTLHRPQEYDDPQATANARLAAELPYLMAVSRVMHYLHAILRDVLHGTADRASAQAWLERWIADYVDPDAGSPGAFAAAARPFASAEIFVDDVADSPGLFTVRLLARPHL